MKAIVTSNQKPATRDRKPVTRKIFILVSVLWFLVSLSGIGCANAAGDKPSNELVYLKVENAVASSFDETPDWAPRPDAMAPVDGNPETRWSSGYKDNEWIYFDFGKPKTMSKIIIRWEQAYPPRYEILASDDAQNWNRLVILEGEKGGVKEVSFKPATARYVKVLALERVNPEWGISIWEFEPYGPKENNPGDMPLKEMFKAVKAKTENEKKAEELRAKILAGYRAPSPGPVTKREFQRGIQYTSWDRDELDTEMSDAALAYIADLDAGHIALMVVWYQADAVSPKIYEDEKKTASDASLAHAIAMIHSLGMKVMLKPHIDLADEDARTNILPSDEWFKNYKAFILKYAKQAAENEVELLCIGTELSNTTITTWKERWADIIKEIRDVYKGPITYAANWDEYDTVSFWELVDFIGMDAYFPLTDKANPSKEELIAGWTKHADTLEKWRADGKVEKPIIFTEVGYDTMEGSNTKPWRVLPTLAEYKESQAEQANCLEALFIVLTDRPWFNGFYWWNYFPRPDLGPLGYTLRGKLGEKALSEWYKKLSNQKPVTRNQ